MEPLNDQELAKLKRRVQERRAIAPEDVFRLIDELEEARQENELNRKRLASYEQIETAILNWLNERND